MYVMENKDVKIVLQDYHNLEDVKKAINMIGFFITEKNIYYNDAVVMFWIERIEKNNQSETE